MKKQLNIIVPLAFLFLCFTLQGQQRQERKGENKIEKLAYIDAIKIFERVANKGYESADLLMNLGDSYYFNGKLEKANIWYSKLFNIIEELDQQLPSEYYYRHAQTLKSVGDYTESDNFLEKFKTIENSDSRALLFESNKDYLEQIKANSGRHNIEVLDINSLSSDYGSAIYKDHLIFASARKKGSLYKRIHTWTGERFTKLYTAPIDEEGNLGKVKLFANEINSKFNQSTPVFSSDGETVYFTRNNYLNGKRGRDSNNITLLKIYKATLENEKWKNIEPLPFNSDDYSTAHPALSADGKWLYFASDRDGGYGQSDLYKVAILADGGFGEPINLGNTINTEGRESFPFITKNNELYFSTDGRPGLGGLDIYATKINDDGSFTRVQNIGASVNGPLDDFAYYIDSNTRKGFFTSNRDDNCGDDIYSFVETKRLNFDCYHSIQGLVYDKKTNVPLVDANLVLYDSNYNKIKTEKTDEEGKYMFDNIVCGNRYRINASVPEYNTSEVTTDIPMKQGITQVDFGLEKTMIEVKNGDDLFKVLKLQPIYFDFDESYIRPDAAVELAKIVEVLLEHPNIKIDVRSHTDSRGDDEYNLALSDSRAKFTIRWLINHGIDESRLTAKGYGETELVNHCSNGVKCSEEEHQQNRRSEFIVLEL